MKLVLCPVVESTPALSEVLYTGHWYVYISSSLSFCCLLMSILSLGDPNTALALAKTFGLKWMIGIKKDISPGLASIKILLLLLHLAFSRKRP